MVAAASVPVGGQYIEVRKLGDHPTQGSSGEEFHELRKKAKRLRYAPPGCGERLARIGTQPPTHTHHLYPYSNSR
jgi:CHAD domain-containing protein